jgi:hypothetical protein
VASRRCTPGVNSGRGVKVRSLPAAAIASERWLTPRVNPVRPVARIPAGGRAFFHLATPPGPQAFGKKGNGPDAVVRARCRRPRQGRGNHYRIPASAASYGSYRNYRRAKPDNRHPGWFGEQTFTRPYLADPVEPRPLGCQCDHSLPLELDADGPGRWRCLKCGLPARRRLPLLTDC